MPLIFRSLLPIGLAALLIWLVEPMFSARMDALRASTVVGTVIGHNLSSGKHSSSYTTVRYTLPDTWPMAAGTTQIYVVPWIPTPPNPAPRLRHQTIDLDQ